MQETLRTNEGIFGNRFLVRRQQQKIDARLADPKGSYFYCPSCGERVIVNNQGKIKRPHVAHKDILDCDTWIHPSFAKYVLSEVHLRAFEQNIDISTAITAI